MASRPTSDGMRLLLDEHLSPIVATELRGLGHDAVAVAERPELRGRSDDEIFAAAAADRRAIVTFDVVDYVALVHRSIQLRRAHGGVVLLSPARMSSGRAMGGLVADLAALMAAHPADDAFSDRVEWLQPLSDHSSSQR